MIAVLCPTRDHPDQLASLHASMLKTSDHAVLAAYVDDDQAEIYAPLACESLWLSIGPRLGPVGSINALATAFPDFAVYGVVPDDAVFMTQGWDRYLLDVMETFPNRIGMVSAAHNNGEFVNFPWVSGAWLNVVGWFFYPDAFHFCCDTILEMLAEGAGVLKEAKAEEFLMWHHANNETNRQHSPADCEKFLWWCVQERRALVRKLREAIHA